MRQATQRRRRDTPGRDLLLCLVASTALASQIAVPSQTNLEVADYEGYPEPVLRMDLQIAEKPGTIKKKGLPRSLSDADQKAFKLNLKLKLVNVPDRTVWSTFAPPKAPVYQVCANKPSQWSSNDQLACNLPQTWFDHICAFGSFYRTSAGKCGCERPQCRSRRTYMTERELDVIEKTFQKMYEHFTPHRSRNAKIDGQMSFGPLGLAENWRGDRRRVHRLIAPQPDFKFWYDFSAGNNGVKVRKVMTTTDQTSPELHQSDKQTFVLNREAFTSAQPFDPETFGRAHSLSTKFVNVRFSIAKLKALLSQCYAHHLPAMESKVLSKPTSPLTIRVDCPLRDCMEFQAAAGSDVTGSSNSDTLNLRLRRWENISAADIQPLPHKCSLIL